MAVATALAYSSLIMIFIGMPLVLVGIEIGAYAGDRELADHFQNVFVEYSSQVKAYIPFFRSDFGRSLSPASSAAPIRCSTQFLINWSF